MKRVGIPPDNSNDGTLRTFPEVPGGPFPRDGAPEASLSSASPAFFQGPSRDYIMLTASTGSWRRKRGGQKGENGPELVLDDPEGRMVMGPPSREQIAITAPQILYMVEATSDSGNPDQPETRINAAVWAGPPGTPAWFFSVPARVGETMRVDDRGALILSDLKGLPNEDGTLAPPPWEAAAAGGSSGGRGGSAEEAVVLRSIMLSLDKAGCHHNHGCSDCGGCKWVNNFPKECTCDYGWDGWKAYCKMYGCQCGSSDTQDCDGTGLNMPNDVYQARGVACCLQGQHCSTETYSGKLGGSWGQRNGEHAEMQAGQRCNDFMRNEYCASTGPNVNKAACACFNENRPAVQFFKLGLKKALGTSASGLQAFEALTNQPLQCWYPPCDAANGAFVPTTTSGSAETCRALTLCIAEQGNVEINALKNSTAGKSKLTIENNTSVNCGNTTVQGGGGGGGGGDGEQPQQPQQQQQPPQQPQQPQQATFEIFGLSQTDSIGIVAGGGALLLIIIIVAAVVGSNAAKHRQQIIVHHIMAQPGFSARPWMQE